MGGRPSLAQISWEEEITGQAVMARSVALVIPELRDGKHTLELAMEAGEDTATTKAEIVVDSQPIEPVPARGMTRRPRLTRVLCGDPDALSLIVGNEQHRAATAEYRDLETGYFTNSLEPPPCPTHLYEILEETGHGY